MNRFPPGPPPYRQPLPPNAPQYPPQYGPPQPYPQQYGPPPGTQGYGPGPARTAPSPQFPPSGTIAAVASVTHALVGQSERRALAHLEEMEKLGAGLQDLRAECHATLTAMRLDPQRAQLFGEYLNAIHGDAEAIRHKLCEEGAALERDLQTSYRRLLDMGLPMIISSSETLPPQGRSDSRFGREMFGPFNDSRQGPPPQGEPQPRPRPQGVPSPRRAPSPPPYQGPRVVQGPPPRTASPRPEPKPEPRPEPRPEVVTLPPVAAFSAFAQKKRPAAELPRDASEKMKANGPAAVAVAPPPHEESVSDALGGTPSS